MLERGWSSLLVSLLILIIVALIWMLRSVTTPGQIGNLHSTYADSRFWQIQGVDTMKFSRDVAREKAEDDSFDPIIDQQIKAIAETGATHVAISTPYDDEFIPFMKRWVDTARKYNLKVWFRGNMSGWEEWFDYPRIDRVEHTQQIRRFILNNRDLFEDGDIFTSCPECENGGPGDPRLNGDAEGHKQFLIDEYNVVVDTFKEIDKEIIANYYSMNGDVARLIMDKRTTAALDGIVTIDHYVGTREELLNDINGYVEQSGGKVVLGEWGAPIPDIHGQMTEEQQAAYIDDTFELLLTSNDIVGINYWTNWGGSTELWNSDGTPRKGVETLTKYFDPYTVYGTIQDNRGNVVKDVKIESSNRTEQSVNGFYSMALINKEKITFSKDGYQTRTITVAPETQVADIILVKTSRSFSDKLSDYFFHIFKE